MREVTSATCSCINRVRMSEYHKGSEKQKAVFKGARYLLLRRDLDRPEQLQHLRALLELNETLLFARIMRDDPGANRGASRCKPHPRPTLPQPISAKLSFAVSRAFLGESPRQGPTGWGAHRACRNPTSAAS